jgi:hypothetical protein
VVYVAQGYNFYRKFMAQNTSGQKSYEYAKGALKTIELKTEHLLAYRNTDEVKKVMALHFANYMYGYYTLYPDLANRAEGRIKEMGIQHLPVAGGKNFKRLAGLTGFKTALQIRALASGVKRTVGK